MKSSRLPRAALPAALLLVAPVAAAQTPADPARANAAGRSAPAAPASPSASAAPIASAAPSASAATGVATATDTSTARGVPASVEVAGVPAASAAPPPADAATEVTVAGTRVSKTAGSSHVIRRKQLERFEYDDPQAVLQQVPGVYARGEDGVGLRPNIGLRGVNPDRSKKVALMEDGIPFAPAPYSASAAYYFPNITRMTQVRVLKGPASISYGPQTVGGAIDLVTRPIPTGSAGGADLAAGAYGYGKVHAHYGASDERGGYLVEYLHLRNDGFKHLPSGADTGFFHNEAMFKGSLVLDPKARARHELRLKFTYSDEVSNETYLGLSDADFRRDPDQRYAASQLDRMKWFRTAVVVSHVFTASDDLTVTTSLYRNTLARVWRKANHFRGADLFEVNRDAEGARNAVFHAILTGAADSSSPSEALFVGPNERDFVSQGVETRVRWNTRTGPIAHRVEYGARVHEDRIERRHSETAYMLQGGQLVPEGTATVVTAYNEASTQALALHVIDAITWDRLTLTPGVRAEAMFSTFVDKVTQKKAGQLTQVVLPGVGAYYALTEAFGALAGVYRGFSPPAPTSGTRVEPELSVNYEGGVRFARGPARAEVIGFYNDYSNLTDTCTFSSGCNDTNLDRQFDAGRARIFGFEAFAEHEIPVGKLRIPLTVAYTFTRAEFLRAFTSDDPIFGAVAAGDEVPYIPRHQLNATLGLEGYHGGVTAGATYVAAMREEAGSAPVGEALHTDEQFSIDVSGTARIWGPVFLYANVRNLLDGRFIVSRRPYGARPNAPRWVQVGAKVSF